MPKREQAADDEEPTPVLSLRGLLARIARNTTPPARKGVDDQGRTEVRGD